MPKERSIVLVVDDHPSNLKVLFSFLEKHEFDIRVADSGERTLDAIKDAQVDIILLDVMMPGMNGFETCKKIKANTATATIPIIFMTALNSIEDKVAGFDAGGVDYITKPFQKAEVLSRLRTQLCLKNQQQELNNALREVQQQSEILEQQVHKRTDALQNSNAQLERQKEDIQEKNIALKVILDHNKLSLKNQEETVATQLKQLVYPYIELLHNNLHSPENIEYLSLITKHLDTIVASFSENTFSPGWKLTAKETLVADLVKKGMNTQKIGTILKIAPRTAETYRNSIRKKIGLTHSKTRLRDYLRSNQVVD